MGRRLTVPRRAGTLAAALLALGLLPWSAGCGGGAEPDLRMDAALLAEPIGEGPAALYLGVRNAGGAPDTLEEVSSAVAERAELHRQVDEDGRLQMRAIDALEVPARGALRMRPGGDHVMLMGLRETLAPGDTVEVRARFRRSGWLPVRAAVVPYLELMDLLDESENDDP